MTYRLLSLLVLVLALAPARAAAPVVDPATLEPTEAQRQATRLITRFISQYHYRKTPLDDELSAVIHERFLEALDPNRHYLLAADVADLERHRLRYDDMLRGARLEPAFDAFRLFRRRMEETMEHALELVDREFDFAREEYFEIDRSESPWPADRAAREELWRKRVKHDVLSLRLADKDEAEIRDLLRKRYQRMVRRVDQLGPADVYQLFMNAYTGAVEPHTAYFSPRTSENFKIHLSLSLEGIGAALSTENDHTVVKRIIPGGPADLDGELEPEDRITGVAQEGEEMTDVVAWRLEDVVDLIRGPKGTTVRLQVLPKDSGPGGPRKVIALVRDKIKLEEQAAKRWTLEPGDPARSRVGVIEIPSFYMDVAAEARGEDDYRSTTRDVRRLLGELEAEGVDGVVVDLRGNGGGALTEAVNLTGLFIEDGPVVQVRDANGRTKVEKDPDDAIAYRGPLVVLVDRSSASASEIFAGAIQDYGRGIVVGEPTYGKGTVQSLLELERFVKDSDAPLGQLKTTIAQFFRVNGESTQHRGVVPDIVYPTAFDIEDHGERALDNALPWASVRKARFRPYGVDAEVLEQVAERHEARLAEDPVFSLVMTEARDVARLQDEERVTLVEELRRARQETRSETRKTRSRELRRLLGLPAVDESEGEDGEGQALAEEGEDKEGDVWLREAARILADYTALAEQPAVRLAGDRGGRPRSNDGLCLFGGC